MKTLDIYNSKSANKMQEYQQLASELHADTKETAETISDELMMRCLDESTIALNNAKNADCEYTAYVNCNLVEVWNNMVNEILQTL